MSTTLQGSYHWHLFFNPPSPESPRSTLNFAGLTMGRSKVNADVSVPWLLASRQSPHCWQLGGNAPVTVGCPVILYDILLLGVFSKQNSPNINACCVRTYCSYTLERLCLILWHVTSASKLRFRIAMLWKDLTPPLCMWLFIKTSPDLPSKVCSNGMLSFQSWPPPWYISQSSSNQKASAS